LIINEGATRPVSTGWVQLGIRRIGHCGGGPEAAKVCPFRSGVCPKVLRKTVLATMAVEVGFGPIHLAQPGLISSVSIVSIVLLAIHPHSCSLSNTPKKTFECNVFENFLSYVKI